MVGLFTLEFVESDKCRRCAWVDGNGLDRRQLVSNTDSSDVLKASDTEASVLLLHKGNLLLILSTSFGKWNLGNRECGSLRPLKSVGLRQEPVGREKVAIKRNGCVAVTEPEIPCQHLKFVFISQEKWQQNEMCWERRRKQPVNVGPWTWARGILSKDSGATLVCIQEKRDHFSSCLLPPCVHISFLYPAPAWTFLRRIRTTLWVNNIQVYYIGTGKPSCDHHSHGIMALECHGHVTCIVQWILEDMTEQRLKECLCVQIPRLSPG
ncbi:uncharacterized protein WM277_022258 [Molossus nigricans]